MKPLLCTHCRTRRAYLPGPLCWFCYFTPGVRVLYRPARTTRRRTS